MLDSVKRIARGSVVALAIIAPGALTPLSANAAPLQGEGSMAALIHQQAIPPIADVAWRRHYYWAPGAVFAGATLGLLGAALAAPAYATGYCGPYYGYCGAYPGDYYAYYPGPAYGYYGYYHRPIWRHHYYRW